MTGDEYRAIALAEPEAVEGSHMQHSDFRVRNKIFATLWPDGVTGVLKLTPEQQALLVDLRGDVFKPAKGAWGVRGMTEVRFDKLDASDLRSPMRMAWENTAPETLVRDNGPEPIRENPPVRALLPLLVTARPQALAKAIQRRFGGKRAGIRMAGWGKAEKIDLPGLSLLVLGPDENLHLTKCAINLGASLSGDKPVETDVAGNFWYGGITGRARPVLHLLGMGPALAFTRDCLGGQPRSTLEGEGIYQVGDTELEVLRAKPLHENLLSAFVAETGDVAGRVAASGVELVATSGDGSWAIVRDADWTLWIFDRGGAS
jgi:hypothetical protein